MQSLLLDLITIVALSVAAMLVCHRLRLPSAIELLKLFGIGPKQWDPVLI